MAGPYFDLYDDPTKDDFIGTYAEMYAEYGTTVLPATIKTILAEQGNSGRRIHHLIHMRQSAAPVTDPGKIITIHRTTQYNRPMAQAPSNLDGRMFAFQGESIGQQLPMNVELPSTAFNKASAVQVPTVARMQQLLNDEPNAAMFGPFVATDTDVEAIIVRNLVWVPNKYAKMALQGLTPRDAWTMIYAAVVANGEETECADLLAWLRVALTRKAADDTSRVAQAPLTTPVFDDVDLANKFQAFRLDIMHSDLPNLTTTTVAAAGQVVADGLAELVTETRLGRVEAEARRAAEANKTPKAHYKSSINKLMRLCQVARESDLPAYHSVLANTKKVGAHRSELQNALMAACEDLDYEAPFSVSAALARKVHDLEWETAIPDDLSTGISVFNLGQHDARASYQQRLRNAEADLLQSGGSTPNHHDAVLLLDSSGDVAIPRSAIELELQVQKMHALLQVLLGSTHPLVKQYKAYLAKLSKSKLVLERADPPKSQWGLLKWASFARRLQIDTNFWFSEQMSSADKVEVPDFLEW
ncbi:MAG: hypothetical protein SGARI_000070 [Bacillariaceae sp.]